MDHSIDPGACRKDRIERLSVKQIHLVKDKRLSSQLLDPPERFPFAVDEIVYHGHAVTCLQKRHASMTANVTSASGNQYVHRSALSS